MKRRATGEDLRKKGFVEVDAPANAPDAALVQETAKAKEAILRIMKAFFERNAGQRGTAIPAFLKGPHEFHEMPNGTLKAFANQASIMRVTLGLSGNPDQTIVNPFRIPSASTGYQCALDQLVKDGMIKKHETPAKGQGLPRTHFTLTRKGYNAATELSPDIQVSTAIHTAAVSQRPGPTNERNK